MTDGCWVSLPTHAPCTSLLRTTDGGRSWRGVPAPRAAISTNGAGGTVSSIRFADPKFGFAFAPGLWTTKNGGADWTRTRSLAGVTRFAVLSLAATSDDSVYALAAPTGADAAQVMLLRAAPGSTKFVRITTGAFGPNLISAGASVYVESGPRDLRSFGPLGAHTVKLPGTDCDIAASSRTALLAICGEGVGGGSMGDRRAFGSTDGGARWTRLPNPGEGDGYDSTAVAQTTNGHAVIATLSGGAAGLLETGSYAQTWHTVLSYRNGEGYDFKDLGFESNRDGSVIYNPVLSPTIGPATGILLRTTDGGASWHRVPYSYAVRPTMG